MERWSNQTAVVTGASSGIGAAIAVDLILAGMIVAGFARRVERIEQLRDKLPEHLRANLHAVKCDVTNDSSVNEAFDWVDKNLGGVDVLVNSAGIFKFGKSMTMDFKDIEDMFQTNILGFVRCARRAYKSMTDRKVDGHVVVINSLAGQKVPVRFGLGSRVNLYPSTKFGVTAFCEVLAIEFKEAGTNIKITSVSPGLTDTEIIPGGARSEEGSILKPGDVSATVLYALGTPPKVQIPTITVVPLGELV